MKKHIITSYSLLLAIIFLVASCDSSVKKTEEEREGGIIVGSFSDNTKSSVNLTISIDEVSKLMQANNRLTLERFEYTYTRAWIEVIEIEQNKYSYYLGVEASLESKTNEMAYSCYSIYTQLEVINDDLKLYKDAIQHSCTGKCCENCKLVLFKDNLGCECDSPSEESDCNGKGNCKHEQSKELTEEQKKNTII